MPSEPGPANSSCTDCTACSATTRPVDNAADETLLAGWPFALTAALYFLLPSVLAVGGALCGRSSQTTQLVGGVLGLGLGMAITMLVAKLRRARRESDGPPS